MQYFLNSDWSVYYRSSFQMFSGWTPQTNQRHDGANYGAHPAVSPLMPWVLTCHNFLLELTRVK